MPARAPGKNLPALFQSLKTLCMVSAFCAAMAIDSPAQGFRTLFSFNSTDGANPHAGVIQATDGNFYGTTVNGGANNFGTIFKLTPSGTLTTLYTFCSQTNCTDGDWGASLVQGADRNFYGTTWGGGPRTMARSSKSPPAAC
jgi:uncharacterized repeat protein (TIGR03803 family)